MTEKGASADTLSFATQDLPTIDYGDGVYLYDTRGKQYLDGSGGPAVYCLGHRHPRVNEAIKRQLDRIAHGYRYHFDSEALVDLKNIVARLAGGGLQHVVFSSSGSEAVEGCLSVSLQFHHANGEPERKLFLSRERSYHGSTFGALSITGFAQRKFPFEGGLIAAHQVTTPNLYRRPEGVPAAELADYYAAELTAKIEALGPERISGFVFEPVVGAALGVMPPPDGYAARVRSICDQYGILMIADEVMCGAGRTGPWRALAYDGVEPDLMAVAKGLGAGYIPIGATLYQERIHRLIRERHGELIYGHTFTGHTLACAAALEVQRIIEEERLAEKVALDGAWLGELLQAELGEHPHVGDIRGRGFFWGIEFVADRASRRPFLPEQNIRTRLKLQTMTNGLVCYPVGGFVDHHAGDGAILSPSYLATRAEISEIVARFAESCRQLFADLPG